MEIIEGTIASPKGYKAGGVHAGLKKRKKDMGWIVSDVVASAAGVYTTNQIKAAPLRVTKAAIDNNHQLQAIIVNSAIANACTGEQGLKAAFQMQKKMAGTLGIEANNIGVASTGVIGEQLPMDVIEKGIDMLSSEPSDPYSFHQAILTTDIVTKEITVTDMIDGHLVTMSGVAKGSGMIHPNMATMLSFITTDAKIDGNLLQEMLKETVDSSYNQITVDGDTSTNDMVIIMANGCSGCSNIQKNTTEYEQFKQMFQVVAETLAKKIAKDGEGATKLIEVEVKGSKTILDGRMIAKKVVGSSLVKAAMFGEDPNWGRIICAIGYSEREINPDTIDVWIGGEQVLSQSTPIKFDANKLHDTLEQDFVKISVDLNSGNESGIAWGCDLSYKYVEINACYTT